MFSRLRALARVPPIRIGRARSPAADLFTHVRSALPGFKIQIAFDVGANVGQTVAVLTRNAPRAVIYSFEPVTAAYRELLAFAHGRKNVHCFNVALGASRGAVTMRSIGTRTSNRIIAAPHKTQSEQAVMQTGDDFCAEQQIQRVSYLKIDTEGHDLEVLIGFRRALEEGRVDLIEVEAGINPGNTWHVPLHKFMAFTQPLGYRIFRFHEQKLEKSEPILRRVNAVFISGQLASQFRRK